MATTQIASPNPATNISQPSSGYVPGVCNINSAEVAYRRKAGFIMLAITLVLTIPLFILPVSHLVRLLLFLPIFVTAVCFLQVKYKFCVSYGAAGKQNATEGDKVAQDIIDQTALKLDKARTRKINTQAAMIALAIAIVLVLIPLP